VSGIGSPFTGPRASGTVQLQAGAATVSEPSVTAESVIFLTIQGAAGDPALPYVASRTPGTGFVISSLSNRDASTVGWLIIG